MPLGKIALSRFPLNYLSYTFKLGCFVVVTESALLMMIAAIRVSHRLLAFLEVRHLAVNIILLILNIHKSQILNTNKSHLSP
jgi:hypothetical protein